MLLRFQSLPLTCLYSAAGNIRRFSLKPMYCSLLFAWYGAPQPHAQFSYRSHASASTVSAGARTYVQLTGTPSNLFTLRPYSRALGFLHVIVGVQDFSILRLSLKVSRTILQQLSTIFGHIFGETKCRSPLGGILNLSGAHANTFSRRFLFFQS